MPFLTHVFGPIVTPALICREVVGRYGSLNVMPKPNARHSHLWRTLKFRGQVFGTLSPTHLRDSPFFGVLGHTQSCWVIPGSAQGTI